MEESDKIKFVIEHYNDYSKKKLSEHLNVSSYWIRGILKSLSEEGKIKLRCFPSNRKTPDKIQYIKDNYSHSTQKVLSEKLGESPRWVKRIVSNLIKNNEIAPKSTSHDHVLVESDWTESIKNRSFELRKRYLKTNLQICQNLREEFKFIVNPPSFQFWMKRFGCKGVTKREWMGEYITKNLIEELLNKSYRMTDISDYIKKIYGVYISDDLILVHVKKLGLLSYRLTRNKKINEKAQNFSKEWLSQKIQGHVGLRGLTEEMGVSKTIVMKRLNEESLRLAH